MRKSSARLNEGSDPRHEFFELIGGFAASGFTAAPHPVAGPAEVWLMDPNWIPTQRIALPPFTQKFPKN